MGTLCKASCACGTIKFELELDNLGTGICHCDTCRKQNSGFLNAITYDAPFETEHDENLQIWESSTWAERAFCKTCGTTIFYRLKGQNQFHISTGLFENHGDFELKSQIFTDVKADYLELKAETNNMTRAECFAKWG